MEARKTVTECVDGQASHVNMDRQSPKVNKDWGFIRDWYVVSTIVDKSIDTLGFDDILQHDVARLNIRFAEACLDHFDISSLAFDVVIFRS